jgi:hypothetical protein
MNFRRDLKAAIYMVSVVFFVAVTAHSALAWTWAHRVRVYDGPGLCVQGDAGIDHRQPNVFSGNLAYDGTYALSQGCGAGLNLPYGRAAARLDVYKWTGSDWAFCRGTNWQYGATGVNEWGPWGPAQILDYGGSSSCGAGFYGTQAYAYVWDGSAWRGGAVWSGFEFVP